MDEMVTSYGSRFLIAAFGVGLAMLCLVAVLWFLRNRAPAMAPFMRPARARQPRLQVLDAAPVDSRRRLLLIRRDDVEHLIMVGGPTDIVIESRINEIAGAAAAAFEPQQRLAATTRPLPIENYEEEQEEASAPVRAAAARPARAPVQVPQPTRSARAAPSAASAHRGAPELDPEEQLAAGHYYDEFYDAEADNEDALAEMLEASRRKAHEREPAQPTPQRREAAVAQSASLRTIRQPEQPVAGSVSASDFERVLEEEMAAHLGSAPRAAPAQRLAQPAQPPAAASQRVAPARPMAPPLMSRTETINTSMEERRQAVQQPAPSRPLPQSLTRPVAATAPPRPAPQPARATVTADASRPAAGVSARPPSQPNLQREIARIFGEISTKRGQ